MEAFGTVSHRPMAVISAGFTDSVYQRKSMRIEVSKKLSWSGGISNSVFLDKGHLEYYNSGQSQKMGCLKVFAGSKTEKKMKKKDIESKEKKKRLKMLKGLSRDLLMFSKTGFGLESGHEVQPELISDAVMNLQAQMQQLLNRENEQMLKSEADQNCNLDSEMLASCSSESSDSECDVLLDSAIDMQQDPVVLLQGQMQQLRIKEKEVKKKRKEERKQRMKKLDCGMESSSSSESSDSECEKNNPSCFLLPAEKQSLIELQEIVPQMSSMFGTTEVLEEDNLSSSTVKEFGQGCITEIVEYTVKPKSVQESTTNRVEVCMGGKCKKSGALLLMEEFQRQFGIEGAVSGCKCMGKCKSGPNVRVLKSENGLLASSPPTSVGLGDVGSIVANILGESGLPEAIKPPFVEV